MTGLDRAGLEQLARVAADAGVVGLGIVRLAHPGYARAADAFEAFVTAGWHGEMGYLARSPAARRDPSLMLPDAKSLLIGVMPHAGQASAVARYAQHRDYHMVLHGRLERVDRALRELLPDVDTQICVDTRPVLERAAAMLAGLGFIGKNGCLITPGLGSYVLIGSVLTTAEWLGVDGDVDVDRALWDACGSCKRCLDACPTDAFEGPGRLDPRRCISYLTIEHRGPIEAHLAERVGERIAGCDVCQEVCPYNHGANLRARAPDHAWAEPVPAGALDMSIEELATARSGQYRTYVRDTPLRRIPRRAMQRNAALALGNRGGDLAATERDALERALACPDPVVADAARWALTRRTGRRGG